MRDARGAGCLIMLFGVLVLFALGKAPPVNLFFFLASLMIGWTVFMWHYRR